MLNYVFCKLQIRIDKLIDKWSGSIEIGVTTHDPEALEFPATMTNLRSGKVKIDQSVNKWFVSVVGAHWYNYIYKWFTKIIQKQGI